MLSQASDWLQACCSLWELPRVTSLKHSEVVVGPHHDLTVWIILAPLKPVKDIVIFVQSIQLALKVLMDLVGVEGLALYVEISDLHNRQSRWGHTEPRSTVAQPHGPLAAAVHKHSAPAQVELGRLITPASSFTFAGLMSTMFKLVFVISKGHRFILRSSAERYIS